MALHVTLAAKRDEDHTLFFAWLEPNGSSGRNIQAHAIRGSSVEMERAISLEKMVVAADLNWPIAKVPHK